jgi:hypothetical protein
LFRFLSLLLKAVKYIDSSLELGDIDDPKGSVCLPQSNFTNARTDRPDRLPVLGLFALLDAVELIPGLMTRIGRKGDQVVLSRDALIVTQMAVIASAAKQSRAPAAGLWIASLRSQ